MKAIRHFYADIWGSSEFLFLKNWSKKIVTGAATKVDEYVPIIIPIVIAKKKSFILSPPKIHMAKEINNVVPEVRIVLERVSFAALLILSEISEPTDFCSFSRLIDSLTIKPTKLWQRL